MDQPMEEAKRSSPENGAAEVFGRGGAVWPPPPVPADPVEPNRSNYISAIHISSGSPLQVVPGVLPLDEIEEVAEPPAVAEVPTMISPSEAKQLLEQAHPTQEAVASLPVSTGTLETISTDTSMSREISGEVGNGVSPARNRLSWLSRQRKDSSFAFKSAKNVTSMLTRALTVFGRTPSNTPDQPRNGSRFESMNSDDKSRAPREWVGFDVETQVSLVQRYKETTPVTSLLKDLCEYGNFQFGEVWVRPLRREQRQSLSHSDSLGTSHNAPSLRRFSSSQVTTNGNHRGWRPSASRRQSATSTFNNSVYTRVESDRTTSAYHGPASTGTFGTMRVGSMGDSLASSLAGTHRSLVPSLGGSMLKPRKPGSILKKSNSLQHRSNNNLRAKPPIQNWRSTNFLIREASSEDGQGECGGGDSIKDTILAAREDSFRTQHSYFSRANSSGSVLSRPRKADSFIAREQLELSGDSPPLSMLVGQHSQRRLDSNTDLGPHGVQVQIGEGLGRPGGSGERSRYDWQRAESEVGTDPGSRYVSSVGVDSLGSRTGSLGPWGESLGVPSRRGADSPMSKKMPHPPANVINNGGDRVSSTTPEMCSPGPSRSSSNPLSRGCDVSAPAMTPSSTRTGASQWTAGGPTSGQSETADLKRLHKEGRGGQPESTSGSGYRAIREKKRKSDASIQQMQQEVPAGRDPGASGRERAGSIFSVKSLLSAVTGRSNDRDTEKTNTHRQSSEGAKRREDVLKLPGRAFYYEAEGHRWRGERQEEAVHRFVQEALGDGQHLPLTWQRGEGELSPGNVWHAGDVLWEDIAAIPHDDERLPAPRVRPQYSLFQLSVGVPVLDSAQEIMAVVMLYRAAREEAHGYGRAEHEAFVGAKNDEGLARVLRKGAQLMGPTIKMQEELAEWAALVAPKGGEGVSTAPHALGSRADSTLSMSSVLNGGCLEFLSLYLSKFRGNDGQPPAGHDLKYSAVVLAGVFLTMLLVSSIDVGLAGEDYRDQPLFALLASFAAVVSMVFCAPTSFFVQPRNIVGGHMIAATVAVSLDYLVHDEFGTSVIPEWVGVAMAPAISSAIMAYLGLIHPPAAALSVIYISGDEQIKNLGWLFLAVPVFVDCAAVIFCGVSISNLSSTRSFPLYW